MENKNLLREVSHKLHKIRTNYKYSITEMAEQLNAYRTSYSKYESGKSFPQVPTLCILARRFGISLDWLLMERGTMKYSEKKDAVETEKLKTAHEPEQVDDVEINEMLEYMDKIPLLRHEVLMVFHRFKEDRKEMIAAAVNK